jgi:hypothetical protein
LGERRHRLVLIIEAATFRWVEPARTNLGSSARGGAGFVCAARWDPIIGCSTMRGARGSVQKTNDVFRTTSRIAVTPLSAGVNMFLLFRGQSRQHLQRG